MSNREQQENIDELKIIVSTWPSAGGTTTSLILADMFDLIYIYAGGVLKDWAKLMGYDPSSNSFHEWEERYGEPWDHMWEHYIAQKLSKPGNYLAEGKITGFLAEAGAAFEVMLTASEEVRVKRASGDQRTETISARDKILQERWSKLFGADIFDSKSVGENYDLIVDNSDLTIAGTVTKICENLFRYFELETICNKSLEEVRNLAVGYDSVYWEDEKSGRSGKDRLKDNIRSKGNYYSSEDVFADWKVNYQTELAKLPEEMRDVL